MPNQPSRIYAQHVENLRELDAALDNVERLARHAIATSDAHKTLRTLLRLHAFLIGAWAECRLKKLLHENLGYDDSDRAKVLRAESQLEQWKVAVEVAFRKHYLVPNAELSPKTLTVTVDARRMAVLGIIENDLKIIIEIRNKLAHGQWIYPFNSAGTDVESQKYRLINEENLLSLQFKRAMTRHLANAMHDLAVSRRTHERDFDAHFKKLFQAQTNLSRRSYDKYAKGLRRSREHSEGRE